jgi:hypothetical protein
MMNATYIPNRKLILCHNPRVGNEFLTPEEARLILDSNGNAAGTDSYNALLDAVTAAEKSGYVMTPAALVPGR